MSEEHRPHLRFAFVELLFALTAAEIAIQFADVYSKVGLALAGAPAYAHLVLALVLVSTSWVGWSVSRSPGARRDVAAVFSADFVVLIIDVLLVICYFIVVKGVDNVEKAADGSIAVVASATNEALWIAVVFAGYFLWDFMTKAIIVGSDKNGRNILGFKLFTRTFWKRAGISATCLGLAIVAWYLVKDVSTSNHVMLADAALFALVLLFRALKQQARRWTAILAVCYCVPLFVIGL